MGSGGGELKELAGWSWPLPEGFPPKGSGLLPLVAARTDFYGSGGGRGRLVV